jgi:type II secretory pathway component GspD/PulD (secretin)
VLVVGQAIGADDASRNRSPAAAKAPAAASEATPWWTRTTAESKSETLTVRKSGPQHTRLIYHLKSTPAFDMEAVIKRLFSSEAALPASAAGSEESASASRVAIVADVLSNSLVISGPPEAVKEIGALLEELDQPKKQVLLEMEIGEAAPDGAVEEKKSPTGTADSVRLPERPANMETLGRIRLTTIDNQVAFVHMVEKVPTITGTQLTTHGEVRSATMTEVGLTLSITPRIGPDGTVVMAINVEQAQVGPEEEGTPISIKGEKVTRVPRIDMTTIQSTVSIPDGQTAVLGSIARQGRSDKTLVITITPRILGPDGGKTSQ